VLEIFNVKDSIVVHHGRLANDIRDLHKCLRVSDESFGITSNRRILGFRDVKSER
jgi:hypothetical protein